MEKPKKNIEDMSVESPVASKLAWLETNKIIANPHNPRFFFHEGTLKILKESITEVGILVPLLIYQRKTDGQYVILDGERRWRCAKDLKLDKIPANIILEPSKLSNILTMFSIHNVREPWELMPTALKLEVIIRILKTRDTKKLSQLTGLTQTNVERCKKLLSFDKKYQDMMIAKDDEKIKADFFIEMYSFLSKLEKEFPEVINKNGKDKIIDNLVEKYKTGVITNVIHFRDLIKFLSAEELNVPKENIKTSIVNFTNTADVSIKDVTKKTVPVFTEYKKLQKIQSKLQRSLDHFITEDIPDKKPIIDILKEMRNIIDEKIKSLELSR